MELSRCCLPAYFAGLVGDASVFYAGTGSGSPGLYQMNFILPTLSKSSIGYGTTCGSELRIEVWASVGANSVSVNGGGTGSNYLSIPVYVSASENLCPATTTLTSSLNPSALGQAVTFTAAVAPVTATGTVTFLDATSTLGTVTLSGGKATFSTSSLSVGSHSISAVYSGDSNNGGSASGILVQTVNAVAKTNSTTTVTSNLNPSTAGQSVAFAANVSPSSATGTVTFLDGASTLGTGMLGGGKATYSTSGLSTGSHLITASYGGDSNYNGSTSVALSQTVNSKTDTTTTVHSASTPGGEILTAIVSPSNASGTVTFFDDGAMIGSATLYSQPICTSGSGQCIGITVSLSGGNHKVTATYSGSSNYNGSSSLPITLTGTSTTLTSSPNPAISGQPINFTATVSPASATGTVELFAGLWTPTCGRSPPCPLPIVCSGNTTISGGQVKCTGNLLPGTFSITAVYSGDANYGGSTSGVLTQIVNAQ